MKINSKSTTAIPIKSSCVVTLYHKFAKQETQQQPGGVADRFFGPRCFDGKMYVNNFLLLLVTLHT